MHEVIYLQYLNPGLNIGLSDWRHIFLLAPKVVPLRPEVYRGKLTYRAKGSGKRFSYERIKRGLLRQPTRLVQEVPDWLY